MTDDMDAADCSRRLKALADPERLRIVQCLRYGEMSVGDIALALEAELANVSHHLGVLRHAGLVEDRRDGKYILYSLHASVFQPGAGRKPSAMLDLGCCRLDLGPAKFKK
jgi:ArsR family transcriptional regulator